MSEIFLQDCVVLIGPELEPWRCSRMRIADERIVEIAKDRPSPDLDSGAFVVMPSMCNGHTHMGDSCLPDGATGMTLEEAFFRPDGYKYRELAKLGDRIRPHLEAHLRYMAQTGTTVHCDFREMGVSGARLLRQAAEATGIDAVILSQFSEVPFTPELLAGDTTPLPPRARQELIDILELSDGFSESTMNDLTTPAWREVRELTEAQRKLRAIHCLENTGYRELSLERTGQGDLVRAIELLDPDLIVHLTVATTEEIKQLAASGKTAVVNPRANANLGLPLPPVGNLLKAGVNLMLGTDNAMLNSPNLFAELDFTYKLAKSQFGDAVGPAPVDILKMVTRNVGQVLGNRFPGILEVGQPASVCVLNFHAGHLRHSRNLLASLLTRATPQEVLTTMRNGHILYQKSGFKFSA